MKLMIAFGGAFLSAVLLLAIIDIYTPERSLMAIPLLVIFFLIWAVGFGYATVAENLKKKVMAVLAIESVALALSAIYFIVLKGLEPKYIFGLVLGAASIIIIFILREKSSDLHRN